MGNRYGLVTDKQRGQLLQIPGKKVSFNSKHLILLAGFRWWAGGISLIPEAMIFGHDACFYSRIRQICCVSKGRSLDLSVLSDVECRSSGRRLEHHSRKRYGWPTPGRDGGETRTGMWQTGQEN